MSCIVTIILTVGVLESEEYEGRNNIADLNEKLSKDESFYGAFKENKLLSIRDKVQSDQQLVAGNRLPGSEIFIIAVNYLDAKRLKEIIQNEIKWHQPETVQAIINYEGGDDYQLFIGEWKKHDD